jgi:hypothetical protein
MDDRSKLFKRLFKNSLEPLLVMLANKRDTMSSEDWKKLVSRSEGRVIQNPGEFLGTTLPDADTIEKTVQQIFSEFLKQKSK